MSDYRGGPYYVLAGKFPNPSPSGGRVREADRPDLRGRPLGHAGVEHGRGVGDLVDVRRQPHGLAWDGRPWARDEEPLHWLGDRPTRSIGRPSDARITLGGGAKDAHKGGGWD